MVKQGDVLAELETTNYKADLQRPRPRSTWPAAGSMNWKRAARRRSARPALSSTNPSPIAPT